ncbi:hypothetical protein HR09_08345 [Porphyromonas gulae]|nr:hypothetical protein HQ50_03565 [Porphyromonas sp. COT-052 OH4946]KGN68169.1 hypothetical protein HR09_08345 [Porphyromonas gulae]KGN88186.1 hypothetical protein HQ46_07460 [Porphyromonas gulae]
MESGLFALHVFKDVSRECKEEKFRFDALQIIFQDKHLANLSPKAKDMRYGCMRNRSKIYIFARILRTK